MPNRRAGSKRKRLACQRKLRSSSNPRLWHDQERVSSCFYPLRSDMSTGELLSLYRFNGGLEPHGPTALRSLYGYLDTCRGLGCDQVRVIKRKRE